MGNWFLDVIRFHSTATLFQVQVKIGSEIKISAQKNEVFFLRRIEVLECRLMLFKK